MGQVRHPQKKLTDSPVTKTALHAEEEILVSKKKGTRDILHRTGRITVLGGRWKRNTNRLPAFPGEQAGVKC